LSPATQSSLKNAFKTGFSGSGKFGGCVLSRDLASAIKELFEQIGPPILQYLGDDARLDGIQISRSSAGDAATSISGRWHTDNVGARIKVFVCLSGDGDQPTIVKMRVFSGDAWDFIFKLLMQLPRWLGLPSPVLGRKLRLSHKTGSVYAFDTDLLHRGAYEAGKNARDILHLEFSSRLKSAHVVGPIGTSDHNAFMFSNRLAEIDSFKKFLDSDRCISTENGTIRYDNN